MNAPTKSWSRKARISVIYETSSAESFKVTVGFDGYVITIGDIQMY